MNEILMASLRLSIPLLFAALGGLLSERSGVINLALEGFMLFGAFAAAAAAHFSGSGEIGWMAGLAVGVMAGALYSLLVIEARADQIVAGTAFNLLAIGIIPFISKVLFDSTGSTPSIPVDERLPLLPAVSILILVPMVWWILQKTPAGLRLRFAGENAEALQSAGYSARRWRWFAVMASGGLAAWGGATLSLSLASSYSPLMSSGRGYIALAALISGRWRPWRTAIACLVFGLADAVQIRLQGVPILGVTIPVQFIQILPYVLTLLILAGFVGISRPPRELGRPLPGGPS